MTMEKSHQRQEEQLWSGSFGRAYTERNDIAVHPGRAAFFRTHVVPLGARSILEIGCGTGLNLRALREADSAPAPLLVGIDPEPTALELLHTRDPGVHIARASLFHLPFGPRQFDLVMTVAVLIHMSLDNLPAALDEIYRVSARYILTHEYFAETETDIPWHGLSGALFKRNFLGHWRQRYPQLRLIDTGYLTLEQGFDRMTFWILEKPA